MNKELGKKNNNLKVRIPMYFVGLFLMTIGIAISVKSNLGVSPVSSIPYTMTCVWGIEMGKATILFHTILVLIQIILLRRNFKPINLLQIAVGVVFGYFTTFCNCLISIITCLITIHSPGSVGIGTVIAAVLVGTVLGIVTRLFGQQRDRLLYA